MQAVTDEKLSETEVKFRDAHACCVVMASKGYPQSYDKGFEITIPSEIENTVYVAGAALNDGKLVTAGGRVLGATAVANSLSEAIDEAYAKVKSIKFDNAYYRSDIGKRALKALATEEK